MLIWVHNLMGLLLEAILKHVAPKDQIFKTAKVLVHNLYICNHGHCICKLQTGCLVILTHNLCNFMQKLHAFMYAI